MLTIATTRLAFILTLFSVAWCGPAMAAPVTDLRVLVDVSGSMKKNDPDNLRASAVRLLVGLVPDSAQAGIWTFGRHVNMAVKHQTVDADWKRAARKEADAIHSRGLFTNIEAVLDKSSYGWKKPDPRFRRHVILLTDGMVDISKDKSKNQASRQRILETLLPRLKRAGVHVHTIGLSKNADAELLATLSRVTGGWHETVSDANQLQKVFLRLFEKSTPVNTLPIRGNAFSVDRNVTDMTLLVFRKADAPASGLITPEKKTWTKANHPAPVSWFEEKGYDLITVKRPAAGQWQIKADADPDNRVMVLTNLRLQTDGLPNSLLPGESLKINAWLEQKGRVVTRKGFLNLVDFLVERESPAGGRSKLRLKDDGKRADAKIGDGKYSGRVNIAPHAGIHELKILAKGATFERMQQHKVRVFESPAEIEVEQVEGDRYTVEIHPYAGLMRPGSLKVAMYDASGESITLQQSEQDRWHADLSVPDHDKLISISIKGTRYSSDAQLDVTVERVLTGPLGAADDAEAEPAADDEPETEESEADTDAHRELKEEAEPEEDPADSNEEIGTDSRISEEQGKSGNGWGRIVIYILLANFLLFGGGFGGWWLWKKRKQKADTANDELDYE